MRSQSPVRKRSASPPPKQSAPRREVIAPPAATVTAAPLRLSAAELILLLLTPGLAFLLLHFEAIRQNGYIDPFFYTGYIHNFHDLFQRYGVTYYGVRFGLIFPARLFTSVFGPIAGYFALRYVLALIFGISLYAVTKRYLSAPAAAITYGVAIGSPFLARTLLWDHPDATGVPFLTAAICCTLLGADSGWLLAVAGGCALGLAGNSNLFTLGIFAIFIVVYCAVSLLHGRRLRALIRQIGISAAAALGVVLAGGLYYRAVTGYLDIYTITLGVARQLSAGGMKTWRNPGFAWTATMRHVFIPVWLAFCAAVAVRRWRKSLPASVMALFGIGVAVFYYAHQFLLMADTLQLFYYFSYAAPAIYFLFALACQGFLERSGMRPPVFACLLIACALAPWVARSFGLPVEWVLTLPAFLILAAGGTLAWIFSQASLHFPGSRAVAVGGAMLFCGALSSGFAFHSQMIHPRNQPAESEMDVYRASLQFVAQVPKAVHGEPVIFWYNNAEGNLLNSVQSTFLRAKLNADTSTGEPGLPALNPAQIRLLESGTYHYLALLAVSPAEFDAGVRAAQESHVIDGRPDMRVISSGSYRFYWAAAKLALPRAAAF